MTFELEFIPTLLMILIAAAAGRAVAKAVGQPAILGELIFGSVIGIFIGFQLESGQSHEPLYDIAIIVDSDIILNIADIGIILLLFSAGMNINFKEFKSLGVPSIFIAAFGVIFPFIFGFITAYMLLPASTPQLHIVAFFIGTALVMTSIGVNAELLMKFGLLKKRVGTLILGAAVIDDIIGLIIMMAFIGVITTGDIVWGDLSLMLVLTVVFFIIPLTVGIEFLKKMTKKVRFIEENLLLFGLIVVIGFAFIAENIKLASIIGAFVAGLLVGQTHIVDGLRKEVSLIGEGFFIPVFFVSIGMMFDFTSFGSVGFFTVILIIVAILSKFIGCGLAARFLKYSRQESYAVGIAMIPRAGVELILVKLGLDYGIIDQDIASAILLLVIVTVLITPISLSRVMKNINEKLKSSSK